MSDVESSGGESARVPDAAVAQLLPALAEAERATEETASRFVSPRPGILEEVSARRHQLVYGRRGVGKSTLLHRVAAGTGTSPEVIFIDIEPLRRRPYPDVLIELLRSLLRSVDERLKGDGVLTTWKRRRTLRKTGALASSMDQLLQEPQTAEHIVRTLRATQQSRTRRLKVGAGLQARIRRRKSEVRADVSADIARGQHQAEDEEMSREAQFVRTKMDGLAEAVMFVREVLDTAHDELGAPTLVVLDDFYHIALDDQPEVLAYLHQVVKGLDISLKVCGVKHRLKPFVDGNPPVGMQPEHDAGTVSLDITLETFGAAKGFLEQVLAGICEPLNVVVDDLLTDGGRERLVLASGGVARDYISLTRRALRNAAERPHHQWRLKNRITAEDVAKAASDLYEQKQEELKQDAGEEAEALRTRLSDVVRFCVEKNRTNVFLVETTRLQEESWGKDIQVLADLRFVHRVDTLSTKRGGETYPGRRFAAFTLDLSTWTSTRSEQISTIQFWDGEGRQKLREPKLIYTPERAHETDTRPFSKSAAEAVDSEVQLLFEFEPPES